MNKKELAEILKKHGLELAEDTVSTVVKGVFKALPEIFEKTENKYDDMTIPFLKIAEPIVNGLIDKIDGEVG